MVVQNIPAEILRVIFNYLSEADLVKNIRLVCKKWNGLAHIKSIALYTYPSINSILYESLIDDFIKNPTFAWNIQQLVLIDNNCNEDDSDDKQVFACKSCPNLSRLIVKTTCSNKLLKYLESAVERLVLDLPPETEDRHYTLDIDLSKI